MLLKRVSGQNVRWPRLELSPGESRRVCQSDGRMLDLAGEIINTYLLKNGMPNVARFQCRTYLTINRATC